MTRALALRANADLWRQLGSVTRGLRRAGILGSLRRVAIAGHTNRRGIYNNATKPKTTRNVLVDQWRGILQRAAANRMGTSGGGGPEVFSRKMARSLQKRGFGHPFYGNQYVKFGRSRFTASRKGTTRKWGTALRWVQKGKR